MRILRLLLLLAGLSALLAGIALVVMPRPAAPRLLNAPSDHDVYLGTETCYVCHPSVRRSHEPAGVARGSGAVHAAVVASPDQPHAAGTSAASIASAPDGSGKSLDALAGADAASAPRYVLQTERGFAILPDQWGMPGADEMWFGDCAGCHVVNQKTGQRLLVGRDFTCEMCHGPGGVHVEALVSPRVSEQLRRLSAPDVDLALCETCHAWAAQGGEK
ncbi:MAG: hypothetical protein IT323_07670 [Anaerolineae bacterium]|nr:hypothetical protein [Anaerolineae bacterium]